MPHITLDPAATSLLAALSGNVEIRDAEGKVIGYFRPRLDPAMFPQLEPPISEEELNRREKEPGRRYTTEEVIDLARRRAAQEGR